MFRRSAGRLRNPVKQVEDCLKEVEVICEDLKAGKVKTREALERLSNII
jgi:hypothetical protein